MKHMSEQKKIKENPGNQQILIEPKRDKKHSPRFTDDMTVEKVEEVTKQLISNFYQPGVSEKQENGSEDKKERTKDDKRHLFLLMFRLYQILPFEKLLKNFGKEFNEVCVKERPAILSRYSLTQFCIAELK